MPDADQIGNLEFDFLHSWSEVGSILLRLIIATLLGALIAFHPQRLRRSQLAEIDWEMKKSQILICLSGAIMVIIIGGSLARAFGLVGLGAFIRFRTAVRNPLEVAIIFVLIVIGMACGLGTLWFATLCAAFIFVLIFVLNLHEPQYTELWVVKTQGGQSDHCRAIFEQLAAKERFHIDRLNLNLERRIFSCRFRPPVTVDVPDLDRQFLSALEAKPDAVQWNRLE